MSLDKGRRGGLSSWCKECRKVSARTWKIKYPEKAKEGRLKKIANYHLAPPAYLETRNYMLKFRYGISSDEYQDLLKHQDYCCAICGRDSREMSYLLHVDHCHTTGQVRGLLCSPCNVYLGYIKDSEPVLTRAKEYLNKKDKRNDC